MTRSAWSYGIKAHRILDEDQPYTFLNSRMALRFIDKRIAECREVKGRLELRQHLEHASALVRPQGYAEVFAVELRRSGPFHRTQCKSIRPQRSGGARTMLTYIIRRLLLIPPTLARDHRSVFFVMAMTPGGIGASLLNNEGNLDPYQKRILEAYYKKRYDLDKPLIVNT